MKSSSLSFWHLVLALGVVIVWGINFMMVKVDLNELPPLTLCTLRFFLAFFPLIFFVKKPAAPWSLIILYGLLIFAIQFSLLFVGMNLGVSTGVAALLLQLQVFFAIFFAIVFIKQKTSIWQIVGAIVAFAGIAVIGTHSEGECTLAGFILIISAAVSWGLGNVVSAKLQHVNMFSLVIWGSFVSFFPLLGVTFFFEDPILVLKNFPHVSWQAFAALAYITYASTHFGYGGWSLLVSKYPMGTIAPFALFAPIIALFCSTLFLGEAFPLWKFCATFLVMAGVTLNLFGKRTLEFVVAAYEKLQLRKETEGTQT